jgi:cob(I)alamin adenosyltransferase
MRIYTKFGDKGSTSLIGGTVVPKNDPRVEAYGAVDELNAALGLVIAFSDMPGLKESLGKVQRDLFLIGAELAAKKSKASSGARPKPLPASRVGDLEKEIDAMWAQLPPLQHFLIPGGSKTASLLHLARTVCRRAERSIITLSQKEPVNPDIITYMNRVGDLLFTQARHVNYVKKVPEVIWKGR